MWPWSVNKRCGVGLYIQLKLIKYDVIKYDVIICWVLFSFNVSEYVFFYSFTRHGCQYLVNIDALKQCLKLPFKCL